MGLFRYKAYDVSGALKSGEVAATTREAALEILARRAEYAVELQPDETGTPPVSWWNMELGSGALPTADLASFARETASLIKANLPIDEALRIVAMQPMLRGRVRRITSGLLNRVLEGEALSSALAGQERAFPEFFVGLVRAGEASGSLGEVFDELADFLERAAATREKITSALVYPAVLIAAAFVVIVVIASVLLPTIRPIFEEAGAEPPLLMRVFVDAQAFLARYWVFVGVAVAIAAGAVAAMLANAQARLALDRFLLRLPVVGGLITERETARFARTFAALVRNGLPVLDAVCVSASVLTNRAFSAAVRQVGADIQAGSAYSSALVGAGVFPDLCLRLATVGDRTGHLEPMHQRIAEIYDAHLARKIDRLTSLVTPVLTLLIGGLVGGLILSVMSAIMSVNELVLK